MLKQFCYPFIFALLAIATAHAEEETAEKSKVKAESKDKEKAEKGKAEGKDTLKEETSITNGTVNIGGTEIHYKATAGNMLLKDDNGDPKASVFFVAYTKEGVEDSSTRPVTYCFNGGPGSSAVWLHIGVFGPKIVSLDDDGYALPPYRLVSNPYSILDQTDLVFIDPVSTGYSRPAPGEDAKQFHGVEEDIQWVAEFVRLYTTRYNRWDSPKFLAGESYGTTRAAGLANYLHENMNLYMNGVILVSSVLNFQTLNDDKKGNDLPYILSLPTYAAVAHYHQKLPEDLQKRSLPDVLKEVETFATTTYTLALMQGDNLGENERKTIAQQLARYTGLTETFITRSNIRIPLLRFSKELLRDEERTIGRFDGRYVGIDSDHASEMFESDPSADAIFGAFTASFNHYVRSELKWEKDEHYKIIANVAPWNYGNAKNEYLSVGETLRSVMNRNPSLRVFVASGYYDLATPFFATDYTFTHLALDPTLRPHITMKYYDAGHMMYTHRPSLVRMKKELSEFISATIQGEHPPVQEPVGGNPKDAF